MANGANNRYALFSDENDSSSPMASPTTDVSRNPFLNQTADDAAPWEEVRRRGAPTTRPAVPTGRKKSLNKDHIKAVPDPPVTNKDRIRIVSDSTTTTNSDKVYNPHENWCGVCSCKFQNKASLLSHIKQSVGHEHYCNLCKRIFKDRNGLKNHVDNSTDHKVFCNLCLSAFVNEWGLKNHFENNYQVGHDHQFVCLTCLLGFRTEHELYRHLQTAEKHTWCKPCQRRFRNQDERDEHWQKTMKHKHCLQPGCDFDGPDKDTLILHHERDHFQCEGCKQILPSQTKLMQHYEKCSFKIPCPQCGDKYPGKARLMLHMEECYFCAECQFHTSHQGNFEIHMTKHSSPNIPCWACTAPMRTYSSLINHLESGCCPNFSEVALLTLCLGKWWYSPLYMDLDIHAQIRTGRINIHEMQKWMNGGSLLPFVCREVGCGKVFAHLSSLVLHCESRACGWDVDRLNLVGLAEEFKVACLRRDSAVA